MTRLLTASSFKAAAAAVVACASSLIVHDAHAGGLPANPDHKIWVPSNTGIPGYVDMNFVAFGPDGRLWTAARDFFWQQGGVAALDFDTGQWKTYSSAQTPLEQYINAIDFEADGSAWIACDDSVVHLLADGETMVSHNPADVVGPFAAISIAPNGHVWVANHGEVDLGGGLFEFDGTTWIKHEEPWMTTWTGFGIAPALNVLARSNGDVWATFQSSPGRMGRHRNGEWTHHDTGAPGRPHIIDMAETAGGTLYGVGAFGAYRMNNATEMWEQIGTIGGHSITIDPVNEWLYIEHGLHNVSRYDGQNWSLFATFPGWTGSVGVAPNGDVWIAAEAWLTHYDLHHYNAQGQMLRIYNRSNTGMPDYFPPWLYLDRDGVMWFTDSEFGATRREPTKHGFNWRNFGIYNGQEEVYPGWVFPVGLPWWLTPGADFWSEAPNQVYHDTQGNFWFRGANYVARSQGDDLSQWTFWAPGQSGLPWLIDSLGEDAQGNIWVGNEYAIYRLDGNEWIDTPIGIPQFAPIGLEMGDDGELYAIRVATVYHVANLEATAMCSLPDGFGVITDLEVDAQGNYWIGTPANGMLFWDGATTTVYTPSNSALSNLAVVDIAIRPGDGLVAVATSQQEIPPYTGGVALFDPATGEWIAYNHGSSFLPFYAPGDMIFDADGDLWVGVLNFGAVQVMLGETDPGVPGDTNGDGAVDVDDLIAVILGWGPCLPAPATCAADVNHDGIVDVDDLIMVILNWG